MLYYEIASVAHAANMGLQALAGEDVSPPWEALDTGIQESVEDGVLTVLENPGITPKQIHENWVNFKKSQGWIWGWDKDPAKKTHPLIKEWGALSPVDKHKDMLFVAIVNALKENTYDDPNLLSRHRNDFTSTRS